MSDGQKIFLTISAGFIFWILLVIYSAGKPL